MLICPVSPDCLVHIEALYRSVAEEMRGTAHDVWWEFGVHPTHDGLTASLQAGNLFVAYEDDRGTSSRGAGSQPGDAAASASRPIGAFVLDGRQGKDYAVAPWGVDAPSEHVAVLHLLAVAPYARGRGVAHALLSAAAAEARVRGAWTLRLDVFDNNAPAIASYTAFGFADRGVFDIEVGGGLRHASHLMELDLREGEDA